MKYLHKYSDYIKENFFKKIFNFVFGEYLANKQIDTNPEFYELMMRFSDKRMDLPALIASENTKLWDYGIRMYKLFYPQNNLIEDCNSVLGDFQTKMWDEKDDATNAIADAVNYLDKFINYAKQHEVSETV